MNNWEKVKCDFSALIQLDNKQKCYIEDAAAITKERLEQLAQGAEPTPAELIAISTVLARMQGSENQDQTAAAARSVVDQWLEASFAATYDKLNYLSCMMQISGCENMDQLLQKYHIFMDGSALCADEMSAFLDRLLPDLARVEGAHKISVPYLEVRKIEDLAQLLAPGVENIARIQAADQLVIRGDAQDKTTRSTFISAFSKFKPDYSMILLTHDEELAKAVEMLNAIGIEGDDVVVLKLRRNSTAALWNEPEETEETIYTEVPAEALAEVPKDVVTEWVPFDDQDTEETLEASDLVDTFTMDAALLKDNAFDKLLSELMGGGENLADSEVVVEGEIVDEYETEDGEEIVEEEFTEEPDCG